MAKSKRMTAPQPTPAQKALQRVKTVAWLDGWSLIVIAGLGFLVALLMVEPLGGAIGLMILTAGVMELRGRRALQRRNPEGMKLLTRSQLFVLTVILVYCARCIGSFDAGYLKDQAIPELRQLLTAWFGMSLDEFLQQAGLTVNELVPLAKKAVWLLYGTVAGVSLLYQGGLTLYYRSKIGLVTEALAALPPVLPAGATGNDQSLYDAVAAELAAQNIKPGLWARSLAETTGEEAHARAQYIRLRVDELKREARLRSK